VEASVRPLAETDAAWVPQYFGDDYLRLYQFPAERTDPEVAFVRAALEARVPGGRVLDLGCGQGRHAVPLAGAGFRVTGLDYQANLLHAAAARARAAGVALPLVRGDMRRLPFDGAFDAVCCLFTAFGYFADAENAAILHEVARSLRPGGWFLLDVANRDALLRHAAAESAKTLPDGTHVRSTWTWDVAAGRYTHRQWLRGADGAETALCHRVRVYTCTELTALLEAAGFRVESRYGGFRGEALTLDAPRLITLAQRA
jgi:SAM-dependent methyltransferase